MSKHVRVSELDFGLEMLVYESKSIYPLEAVSSLECSDSDGVFYVPVIPDYVTGINKITGSSDGYETRKALLACVGHCWDLATAHVKYEVLDRLDLQCLKKHQ